MSPVRALAVTTLAAATLLLAALSGCGSSLGHRAAAGDAGAAVASRAQQPLAVLRGGSFVSAYEASWKLTGKRSPLGATRYQLSSTGAPVDALGISSAGTIALTIDEMPLALLNRRGADARLEATAAALSPLALLPDFVGTPRGAQQLARGFAPHATRLDGAVAAEETYTYGFRGRPNVQVDVLTRHAGRMVLVELDAEPRLAAGGRRALELVMGSWRWS